MCGRRMMRGLRRRRRRRRLYFHAGGKLSFDAPTEKAGVDEYVSDPAHPVPFVGYVTDTIPQRYMADDQRFAARSAGCFGV